MNNSYNPWIYVWFLVMGLLSFIAALAVNDAARCLFNRISNSNGAEYYKYLYALFTLFILIIVAYNIIQKYPKIFF